MNPPDDNADFAAVARDLQLPPDVAPRFADRWSEHQAAWPPSGPMFLTDHFVRETCDDLGLPTDVRDAVLAALPAFRGRPALARLAWTCHRTLFDRPADPGPDGFQPASLPWPGRPDALGPWAEMLHPVVLLSGGPFMLALHRARGIPAEVTRDTAGDLALWMRHHRDRTGRWGLGEAGWLVSHFLGRTYALGRLQFRFERLGQPVRAFRHRPTGRVRLLIGGGDAPSGRAVSPTGIVTDELIELPPTEWECILRPGDPILGMHIPATGPLAFDACGASIRRATTFFPERFPEYPFRAFQCGSWLLSPRLGELLPADSNIARFQREVYLYPLPGATDEQLFERVFGDMPANPAAAPRDTALRRLVLDELAAGRRFPAAACLLFPGDLDWGSAVYRRQAAPD